MMEGLKYKLACWWLESPTIDRIRQYIEEKDKKYNDEKM